jgi:hypothetical protein
VQLDLPSSAHALSDQGALILRHGTSSLQQEVVVRVLPYGPAQELDLAPEPLQRIQKDHQLDVIAREGIGIGHEHPLNASGPHGIA